MKRYIMPTLKGLVAVIAVVALVKIAFFPSSGNDATATPDTGVAAAAQTTHVTTGDISNTVSVKGQIVEDAASEAKATLAGTVDSFAVNEGSVVNAGEPLLYLKKTEAQEPEEVTTTDEEGNTSVETRQRDPKVTWATVTAPVAGKVRFNVIRDQETSVGVVVATVAPGTYSAKGTITPSQQYRLTNAPTTAQLTLEGGPAPFECTGLTIGTRENTSTSTAADGSSTTTTQDGTSVEVRCPVPSDQQVFPGLPVTIGMDAGSATGALLVPVTAVEGETSSGNVWVVTDPADPSNAEKREVKLGINDGTNVQITEGLAEGDTILTFVPGKDIERTGTPNQCDEYACYDANGKEIK